jgi:hypothetical protein
MALLEGTGRLKTVRGEYEFAVDGGAVSTITLRGDNGIPAGSYILGGFIEVDTAVTSGGAATVAVSVESAGDLLAAAAVAGAPWSTTGRKSVIPVFTGATTIKTTVTRSVTIAVATAALTAGKFRVVLVYL